MEKITKTIWKLLCVLISVCAVGSLFSACGASDAVFLEATHFVHPSPQDKETWFEQSITILYNGECEVIKRHKDNTGAIITKQVFYELDSTSMDMVIREFGDRFVEHQDVSQHQNEEQWKIKSYGKKGEVIFDYSGLADNDAIEHKFFTLSSVIALQMLMN